METRIIDFQQMWILCAFVDSEKRSEDVMNYTRTWEFSDQSTTNVDTTFIFN